MCPAHDDDTRIRDVTEATYVEEMMSPSAFSLIRPTIATYVAIPSFYSGGWLASWRLVRVHFIIEAHDRQPSRIKLEIRPVALGLDMATLCGPSRVASRETCVYVSCT